MDPQQSIQPDPPDDDPDQDADQPPPYPSPALLDSALSLVAQPLVSAAARVAASHPIAFPLEDLNDFNVDLSWAAPEIDSAFLNDTEYLQLGDDPQPSPHPHPSLSPQPLPSVSTTATAAIPLSIPDSQLPPVSLSAQTFPSVPNPQNDPLPIPRSRSSSLPRKPSRNRLPQQKVNHNPIPIAPRSLPNTKLSLDRNSASPAPHSMQAQSSLQDVKNPVTTPPRESPDPAPTSAPSPASHEKHPVQTTPPSFTRFPLGMPPHPMMPFLNAYPLQHHQSIFNPSQSVPSPHALNNPDATPAPRLPATDSTKVPPLTAQSTPAPSSHSAQPRNPPQQPFLSPPIQVMPQSMVPYDTNIMPFFQMAYAAAAAGHPHSVVPPLPARSPNMPPPLMNSYGSDHSTGVNPGNSQSHPAQLPSATTMDQVTQQPGAIDVKSTGGPVVVQKAGKQIFVPQQKAARLERHPVLGRLQLKSASKPQVATSTGLGSTHVVETNVSAADKQQTGYVGPNHIATSSANVGPSSMNAGPSSTNAGPSSMNTGPSSVPTSEAAQRQQKKRLVWTQELHERFVKAFNAVGLNNAVPKTIVTIMNVEGLTTEHVKSHLQKYRNSMRKEAAEEERDRGSGAGSSRDLRQLKFGTSSTAAAPGIHTALLNRPSGNANRNSQVRAMATNQLGHPAVPFLPSRMNALEGQMREMLQPRANNGLSKETSNVAPIPHPVTNGTRQISQPSSTKFPSTDARMCTAVESGDQVSLDITDKRRNTAASETHGWRQDDSMKNSARKSAVKSAVTEGNATITEDVISGKHTVQQSNDPNGEQDPRTAVMIRGSEQARHTAAFKQPMTSAEAINSSQKDCSEMNTQAEDRQERDTTIMKANERGENVPSASQSNRDMELELMKEETQQMQLQVQMLVFRTIALEKKLEEIHSGRLNAEVSGRVDSSKRSTGGDAIPEVAATGANKMQGDKLYKGEGAESDKQVENTTSNEDKEGHGEDANQKQFEATTKKRPRTLASEGQTEVEALLGEQMGLQKRLKNASALIDKRMKTEGDQGFEHQSTGGKEWDDASPIAGKKDGSDSKEEKGLDPKVISDQGQNG